jgi:AGZA family xanthine/uracil permease-like MFS transporter
MLPGGLARLGLAIDPKALVGRPPGVVADSFAGAGHHAQASDGAVELALPRRGFLRRQAHGAGVERGHVGPGPRALSGHECVELGAALADAKRQAAARRVHEEEQAADPALQLTALQWPPLMPATLDRWFRLHERGTDVGTEVRAGLTTFMVMAYIIFVNPIVLGYVGVPVLEGQGLPFGATLTVTCLTAGVLSIAMGLFTNYPFALAPGMGLNAVVAFELVAGRGLTWPQAMTIVFLEGVVITVLVLTRFREAMLEAVPLALKRAISVGIGLFIAFIGFFTAGFVVKPATGPLPVALGPMHGLPIAVFVAGFVLTAWLMARRVRGALLLGIVLTTVLAIVLNGLLADWQGFATPGAAQMPAAIVQLPDFSTFGRLDFGVVARLGVVATVLVTFSIMLSDFFDTMGTIIGVGGKGGFLDTRGRLPGARGVLLVDSLGAVLGGVANSSSNTTYIESAAGVAEGGRTGLVAVVTGLLFLVAMWFSPLASVIPAQATAPALVIVGLFMMGVAREIAWDDYDDAIPAFVIMLVMPFTWSITNGIGAGFVTYVAIRVLNGRGRQVHWMLYLAAAAFVVYFLLPLLEPRLA